MRVPEEGLEWEKPVVCEALLSGSISPNLPILSQDSPHKSVASPKTEGAKLISAKLHWW